MAARTALPGRQRARRGLIAAGLALRERRASRLLPIVAVALAFVFGVAMTDPPGALHRLGVALPFVALLLGYAVRALPGKRVALSATALLLAMNWRTLRR